MAGLLGQGWDDPQSQAIMALAGGLLQGNFGGGLLGANQAYGDAKANAMKQRYAEMQMQNMQSEMEARRQKADFERKKILEAERRRQIAPSLFSGPQMVGGEPMPQTFSGTDIPMFSQPSGVSPVRATPGGFDALRALKEGFDLDEIPKLAGLQDIGRPKATRQMEVDDGKGGKRIALVDDFGREVAGFAGYTAPVQVNQGDRVSFVKPAPGMALPVNMSPEARASNALGWANNALTRRGQDMTDARARETNAAGRVPAGYRVAANGQGLEFIPGGPADPNAAKKAAPTEFQGKSAIYGTRAQEADKIITGLEGQYSPAAVNSKLAAENAPWYLGGGVTGAAANALLSKEGQKAEQAQRDFINAVLRQESGAVISDQEFTNARKQYFPQPFDSAAVKAQKAANRKLAIQGILNNARANGGGEPAQPGQPSVDDLLKKYGGK